MEHATPVKIPDTSNDSDFDGETAVPSSDTTSASPPPSKDCFERASRQDRQQKTSEGGDKLTREKKKYIRALLTGNLDPATRFDYESRVYCSDTNERIRFLQTQLDELKELAQEHADAGLRYIQEKP